jgi:hypothetical protein
MQTECKNEKLEFQTSEARPILAEFSGMRGYKNNSILQSPSSSSFS